MRGGSPTPFFYFPRSREAIKGKKEEFCQTRRASDKPPRYKSRHARRAAIAPLITATPTHPNSRGALLFAYPVRSAHSRVDAGDEPGVKRAALGGRKAFAQLRAILDSEDYGGHARDGERVAMGKRGR
jgi:hypothetical protein